MKRGGYQGEKMADPPALPYLKKGSVLGKIVAVIHTLPSERKEITISMRKWVYVVFLIVVCCGCVNKKTAENENGLENNSTTSENININGKVYVAPSDGLNLRSNYGITGEKIKLLPQNAELIVLDRDESGKRISASPITLQQLAPTTSDYYFDNVYNILFVYNNISMTNIYKFNNNSINMQEMPEFGKIINRIEYNNQAQITLCKL